MGSDPTFPEQTFNSNKISGVRSDFSVIDNPFRRDTQPIDKAGLVIRETPTGLWDKILISKEGGKSIESDPFDMLLV